LTNAFFAASVKKVVRWIQLWKRTFWNITVKAGDLYFTKEMLLAVGDRFESLKLPASKAADAKYR
jgi:hypothetical protein